MKQHCVGLAKDWGPIATSAWCQQMLLFSFPKYSLKCITGYRKNWIYSSFASFITMQFCGAFLQSLSVICHTTSRLLHNQSTCQNIPTWSYHQSNSPQHIKIWLLLGFPCGNIYQAQVNLQKKTYYHDIMIILSISFTTKYIDTTTRHSLWTSSQSPRGLQRASLQSMWGWDSSILRISSRIVCPKS